ncbi:uncharacterized protein LOC135478053 [Liolophura sinensis]|uniref:uncharacterized protein LOC135478053 n=1 Tax=Liolophura sinensis TaxID=3198878 RepID=UPI003158A415
MYHGKCIHTSPNVSTHKTPRPLFFADSVIMVRNYKRTTTRGQYGNESLGLTLRSVSTGTPLLMAAREFNIPARTLRRHRDGKVANPGVSQLGRHRIVLSTDVERELHHHVQYMEKVLYGLATTDVRRLAYNVAEKRKLNHPFSHEKRMAGKNWLYGFLSRHQDLSIRAPQGTNISRAVGFNKPKVQQFFGVYRQLLETQDFTPARVWNMDETGITNVHKPGKVLATKGIRQVGKMTSGERGKTVTVICAMNATGVYVPPMMIFPRKRMVDALMNGAPPQAVGYVSPSGWTDSDLFVKWLEHFASFTNATRDIQHIIILDGHHSHKTLAAVTFARQHEINLLTLPPHNIHKMQPLDRTYFKSLKTAYNAAADSWMVANPGKRISFFDIAGIFGKAFLRSASSEKAVHGFLTCGNWPYDENIFSDDDFAPSMVTDQDQPASDVPSVSAVPSTDDSSDDQATNSVAAPCAASDAPLPEENAPPPIVEVVRAAVDHPLTIADPPVSPDDIPDAVAGPSTDSSSQNASKYIKLKQ